MSKLHDLMTMEELARRFKKNRETMRKRCINAGIAIRWGGTEKHPHLKAKLSDVEKMIYEDRVAPPVPRRQPKRQATRKTHYLINC